MSKTGTAQTVSRRGLYARSLISVLVIIARLVGRFRW